MFHKNILLIGLTFLLAFSCQKEQVTISSSSIFLKGIFIINEGSFGSSPVPGGISFYDLDKKSLTFDNIFKSVNQFDLGNVVQSLSFANNVYYIVDNSNNKIECVSADSFKLISSIKKLFQPRYLLPISNTTALISEWGSNGMQGKIKFLNLSNYQISDSLPLPAGPEKMVRVGNMVFVACTGGYANENKLVIIDVQTNKIVQTLQIGDAPTHLQVDKDNKVWVLCKGKYNASWTALDAGGSLYKINSTNYAIEQKFEFSQTVQPNFLEINNSKDTLYYTFENKLFALGINSTSLKDAKILITKSFYGIGIQPTTNEIYASYSPSFSAKSLIIRYQKNGIPIDSFYSGGIGTNSFLFKF